MQRFRISEVCPEGPNVKCVVIFLAWLGVLNISDSSISAFVETQSNDAQSTRNSDPELRLRQFGKYKLKVPRRSIGNPVIITLWAPEASIQPPSRDHKDAVTLFLHFLDKPGPGFTSWEKHIELSSKHTQGPRYREDLRMWEWSLQKRPQHPFMFLATPGRAFPEAGSPATLIACGGVWNKSEVLCDVYFQVKPDVYARYQFSHKWLGEWHVLHRHIGAYVDGLFVD